MGKEIGSVYVLSISDTAKELEVSEQTIRKYIKQGRLKNVLIGRHRYVTWYQLEEFLLGEHFAIHLKR